MSDQTERTVRIVKGRSPYDVSILVSTDDGEVDIVKSGCVRSIEIQIGYETSTAVVTLDAASVEIDVMCDKLRSRRAPDPKHEEAEDIF